MALMFTGALKLWTGSCEKDLSGSIVSNSKTTPPLFANGQQLHSAASGTHCHSQRGMFPYAVALVPHA